MRKYVWLLEEFSYLEGWAPPEVYASKAAAMAELGRIKLLESPRKIRHGQGPAPHWEDWHLIKGTADDGGNDEDVQITIRRLKIRR